MTQFSYLENEDSDRLTSQVGFFLHAGQAQGSSGGWTDDHLGPHRAYIQGKADTMTSDDIMVQGLEMAER